MTKIEETITEKAASEAFNQYYYVESKDTTLERIADIEAVLAKMKENRNYQIGVLCQKKLALRENVEMSPESLELFVTLQDEMDELTKEFKETIKHIGVVSAY
jgi:hypothetical protein